MGIPDDAKSDAKAGIVEQVPMKRMGTIEFEGDPTAEQIVRLWEIAAKCPVGKMLESEIRTVDDVAE